MLLQTEHRRRLAFTSRMALARSLGYSSLERRMENAKRCALLPPTPGSFFNSSISRTMGSANLDTLFPHSHSRQAHAAEHAAQTGLHRVIHFTRGLVYRRRHQVLQHLDVARFHHIGLNHDAQQLFLIVHPHRHAATARRRFNCNLLHFLLQLLRLLPRLRQHFLQIKSTHQPPQSYPRSLWSITVRISAPNFSCMRCTMGSAVARLRAPAPLLGRIAAGFDATCTPPLTILNFSGLPVALLSAA